MTQQTINIGATPNDGDGDPARTAFDKCNDNFDELYQAIDDLGGGGSLTDFANDPATTVGLDYGFKEGRARNLDGDMSVIAAGTITLPTDSNVNIYFNPDPAVQAVEFTTTSIPFGVFRMAQVNTAGGLITILADRRAFANAFGSYSSQQLLNDLKVTDGGGLDVDIAGGVLSTAAGAIVVDPSSLEMDDDTTNYVEIDVTGDFSSNTVGFTSGSKALAEVVTVGGVISSISDRRGFLFAPGNGTQVDPDDTSTIPVDGFNYGMTFIASDANNVYGLATGLPVGFEVGFILNNAGDITVDLNGTETIRINTSVSTAGGNITATDLGATIRLKKITATEWFSIAREGTWTVST